MIENIPALLKAFDTAKSTLSAFTGWKSKSKGDARSIIEELKENSRYLWLVLEENVDLTKVVKKLSTKEYDRLLKEGFDFNNLKNKKIAKYASLKTVKRYAGSYGLKTYNKEYYYYLGIQATNYNS